MIVAKARIAEALAVLFRPAFEVLIRAHKAFLFQLTDNMLHLALLQGHHGVTAGFLIARIRERVQCQRVLFRRNDGFFYEAAYNSRFICS